MERKVVLTALVGSHNYNLDTIESDKDYKQFVLPTFDDLYSGYKHSDSVIGADKDIDTHDIRKLTDLLWKTNINFVEILHSKEVSYDKEMYPEIDLLFRIKDILSRMNLPYLFNACIGMYHNKMKYLDKGTEGTAHLVEQYGYDTKQALHAYRVLDFLGRFYRTGFDDMGAALRYDEAEVSWLLGIKRGVLDRQQFVDLVANKLSEVENLRSLYYAVTPNEQVREVVYTAIKHIVRREIAA